VRHHLGGADLGLASGHHPARQVKQNKKDCHLTISKHIKMFVMKVNKSGKYHIALVYLSKRTRYNVDIWILNQLSVFGGKVKEKIIEHH